MLELADRHDLGLQPRRYKRQRYIWQCLNVLPSQVGCFFICSKLNFAESCAYTPTLRQGYLCFVPLGIFAPLSGLMLAFCFNRPIKVVKEW